LIHRYFKLAENQTSVKQEILGGLTTFVTTAYIVVINPQILAQAGMPLAKGRCETQGSTL
jgi:AGZA family xanthine/uracil permease-like MFS transporter